MGGIEGTVVAVATGDSGPGGMIADGLTAAGASVSRLPLASTRAAVVAAVDGVVTLHGRLDGLVHVAPFSAERRPLVDYDDGAWTAACDDLLRSTLWFLQAAFRHLDAGGRLVVVVDTVAMIGTVGRTAAAAVAEGQRALVKSAARQWGRHGLTVNCIALSADEHPPTLAPRALTEPPDVSPVVAFLLSDASSAVTGATLTLDGGVWMTA